MGAMVLCGVEDGSVSIANTVIKLSYVLGRVGLFVGLFVCSSVHRITYKVMNGFVHSTGDIVASELKDPI